MLYCIERYHYLTLLYQTRPDQTIPSHSIPCHTIPWHTFPYHTIPRLRGSPPLATRELPSQLAKAEPELESSGPCDGRARCLRGGPGEKGRGPSKEFHSQAQDSDTFLRTCCAASSSPQISAIFVGHFTLENWILCKSPQFSAKLPHKLRRQISKSWLAEFPMAQRGAGGGAGAAKGLRGLLGGARE